MGVDILNTGGIIVLSVIAIAGGWLEGYLIYKVVREIYYGIQGYGYGEIKVGIAHLLAFILVLGFAAMLAGILLGGANG